MPRWQCSPLPSSKHSPDRATNKKKPSSSPPAAASPPVDPTSASSDRRRLGSRPRLKLQKKFRHLTELDLGAFRKRSPSAVPSPEAAPPPKSPCSERNLSPQVSLNSPQPLPLPRSGCPGPNYPLPSPRHASSRGFEDRDRDTYGEKSDAVIGSRLSYRDVQKSPEHVSLQKMPQDPRRDDSSQDFFRQNIPVRSAPTSPYSSPLLSPPRQNVGYNSQFRCMGLQGFQAWSAPEINAVDFSSGAVSRASPDRTAVSLDGSPLHSPTISPHQYPKSPNGPLSPLYPKLSPPKHETSGLVNVHPLPLPPVAALTSQVTAKTECLPMAGQWKKGKLIGCGTFGNVFAAINREDGSLCAMKEVEMCPDDPKSAERIKQLQQEINVLSQLKHPNIVQYYGSEIVENRFFIYLEYVYPGSINKYVREHCGAITESVVRNFTRHILSGLDYLHKMKTIHRDIKGANLLVDSSGVVKLADFGTAKHLSGQSADLSLKGSPYWMAPEILQAMMHKDSSVDLAFGVDIWSLGCTIIEMLDGKPPWNDFEGAAAMFKVMRESPPIPPSLSLEGKDFLRCCFRRNPAERPSASKLLEHSFLQKTQVRDVAAFSQTFRGMNLVRTVQRRK